MDVSRVTITPLDEDVLAIEAAGLVEVRALLVCGADFTLLIDTLLRPADLAEVREVVARRGRPLLLANSHADWDHWWGNAAFPDAPVLAHRLTQSRQRREGHRSLAAQRRKDAAFFADVVLRPATIAFEGTLRLDLGGVELELHLLPGHTHDSSVAYLPGRKLLFAADAAEEPVPLVDDGPIRPWVSLLLEWAERVRTVVPAHGAASGPELLHRNAAYLQDLLADPDCPLPEAARFDPFYRRAHRRNRRRAAQERQ